MTRRLAPLALASALLLLGLAAIPACESGTGGRSVYLDAALEAAGPSGGAPADFTTSTGWTVHLDEAVLAIGPIYAYAPEDPPVMAALGALLVPVAHAHGGTDPLDGRKVLAEVLDQHAFDALGGRLALGELDGEAGTPEEVVIVLDPPVDADVSAATHGHNAWIAGTATMGTTTVAFEGGVDLGDEPLVRRVEGIEVTGDVDDDRTFVVTLRPSEWLDEAHFDRLTETAPSGRLLITETSQVRNAWFLGIRAARGYAARFETHDTTGEP